MSSFSPSCLPSSFPSFNSWPDSPNVPNVPVVQGFAYVSLESFGKEDVCRVKGTVANRSVVMSEKAVRGSVCGLRLDLIALCGFCPCHLLPAENGAG